MSKRTNASSRPGIVNQRRVVALQHAQRYRIVVPDALVMCHENLFPTLATAKRTCRSLEQDGLLAEAPLYWQNTYFYLTAEGKRQAGSPPIRGSERPFSESAKIHAFAFVAFCCLQGKHRTRLTPEELKRHFIDLYRPGLPVNYYVDLAEEPPRIGFVRVDLGGRGRWDRVMAKAKDDVESHWLEAGFRKLMKLNRFEIRIITSLPQKADRIRRELEKEITTRKVEIKITSIPTLINLIQPPTSSAAKTAPTP